MPNRSKKFYLNLNINSTWRLKNKCMEKKNENRMIEYFIMDEKFSISELVLKKNKKKVYKEDSSRYRYKLFYYLQIRLKLRFQTKLIIARVLFCPHSYIYI